MTSPITFATAAAYRDDATATTIVASREACKELAVRSLALGRGVFAVLSSAATLLGGAGSLVTGCASGAPEPISPVVADDRVPQRALPPSPATAVQPTERAPSLPVPLKRTPFPTAESAGADTCQSFAVALGAGRGGAGDKVPIAAAIDESGGVAAWHQADGSLGIQRFTPTGSRVGNATAAPRTPGPNDAELVVSRVVLLEQWAVVLLHGGMFQNERHHALLVDRATGTVQGDRHELAMADQHPSDIQRAGPNRFVVLTTRALMSKETNTEGSWLEVSVKPSGTLHQAKRSLPFTKAAIRIADRLVALRTDDDANAPVWLIRREDADDLELIAGGELTKVGANTAGIAKLMAPESELTWILAPGRGGAMLTRVAAGKVVGAPTEIQDPGLVGAVDGQFIRDRFLVTFTAEANGKRFPRLHVLNCTKTP